MNRQQLIYAAFVVGALLAALGIPWLVQSKGGESASGWTSIVNPGPLSPAHQMLEGKCSSCHSPVKGVEAKSCLTCHAGDDFADKQSAKFHAQAKECSSCHIEHDRGKSIIKMDHELLLKHQLWARQPGEQGPHPSASPNSVLQLDCATCHSNRDPHSGLFGRTCSTCHTVETWGVAEFRHPAPTNRECAQCHKPPPSHFMEHFKMVSQARAGRKARVDQCSTCHTTDSWNNIRGKGMIDHH